MCMIGGENKDYNKYVTLCSMDQLHEILLSVGLGHLLLSHSVGLGLSVKCFSFITNNYF